MRHHAAVHTANVLVVTSMLWLSACTSPTASDGSAERVMPPQTPTTTVPAVSLPALSLHDRSGNISNGGFTDAQLDTIAMMPLAIFQLGTLYRPTAATRILELRKRNPDIIILGVVDVLTTPLFWDTELTRRVGPMNGEMYDLLSDRWFLTVEGEPAYMWDNARMVNPMRGNTFDQELVHRFVDVICRYALQYEGIIDGVLYDYMSTNPWLYPAGPATGTIDLNGNGIPSQNDPEELAAWAGFQIAMLHDMQERFGDGFIQVANGDLGLRNAEAAKALAGITLEDFPTLVWNVLPQEGIEMARQLSEPGWLTPRRGRTWNTLSFGVSNPPNRVLLRRLTSMLTGDFYHETRGREGFFPGLDDVGMPNPGTPLAPMQIRETDTSIEFMRRFEHLTVRLEFDGAGRVQDASLLPHPD